MPLHCVALLRDSDPLRSKPQSFSPKLRVLPKRMLTCCHLDCVVVLPTLPQCSAVSSLMHSKLRTLWPHSSGLLGWGSCWPTVSPAHSWGQFEPPESSAGLGRGERPGPGCEHKRPRLERPKPAVESREGYYLTFLSLNDAAFCHCLGSSTGRCN